MLSLKTTEACYKNRSPFGRTREIVLNSPGIFLEVLLFALSLFHECLRFCCSGVEKRSSLVQQLHPDCLKDAAVASMEGKRGGVAPR